MNISLERVSQWLMVGEYRFVSASGATIEVDIEVWEQSDGKWSYRCTHSKSYVAMRGVDDFNDAVMLAEQAAKHLARSLCA